MIVHLLTAPSSPSELDILLERIRIQHELPALAGAILQGDQVLEISAVGFREAGSPVHVTVEDKFHIGSCTKAMTATVIAMLVEQGKLSWETTLAEAFPEIESRIHADYRPVTLHQLLAHRGGIPENLDRDGLWRQLWKRNGSPSEQRWQLVVGVLSNAPEAPAGSRYIYSNAGYAIAGVMAERRTGKTYEELMSEMLFRPLGMKSAGFGAPGTDDSIDQPRGHYLDGKKFKAREPDAEADNPPAIAPAGTVHCTLRDWARFVSLHLQGAKAVTPLLKPESIKTLHTAASGQEYALGWIVTERDWGGRVLTHAGSNTMWYAVVWAAPEKGFAVFAVCNRGDPVAAQACDEAAWELIQRIPLLKKP